MVSPRRRPLIAGNWKMHLLSGQARAYCASLRARIPASSVEIALFPSFPLLAAVAEGLAGSAIAWGGQDLHPEAEGAHTGDVSGAQLADLGCRWVLCGHSERRRDHAESDELVGRKVQAALAQGLQPMVCVGETRSERRAGETFAVLERQLGAALAARPAAFVLAYEPVWAIGSGETATPETAQEAHAFLREALADLIGAEGAAVKRILYGGSVTPDNAPELFTAPDVDGFLVGGASLDPERFSAIIRCCDSRTG